jgi:hypothetical protein
MKGEVGKGLMDRDRRNRNRIALRRSSDLRLL